MILHVARFCHVQPVKEAKSVCYARLGGPVIFLAEHLPFCEQRLVMHLPFLIELSALQQESPYQETKVHVQVCN